MQARSLGTLLCLLLCALPTFASTPASGTITTPTDDTFGTKQTLTFTGGPMVVSTGSGTSPANTLDVCLQAVQPPTGCDQFVLNVQLPSDYFRTRAGNITVRVTWTAALGQDASQDDMDIYIVDDQNRVVGSGTSSNMDTRQALEVAMAINPAPRTYRVIIVNWLSPFPITEYQGTVTFNLTPKPAPPPSTAQIFQNFRPPVVNGAQLGRSAAEPTIGFNPKTGNVMYQADLQTLRVTFNDAVKPATANWQSVGSTITSIESLDPILYTDPYTGRTFVSQLYAACSLLAFTDDDGASWFQNPIGCGIAAAVDHQTVGGGPWAPGLQSVDPIYNYKDSVFYCAQAVGAAQCGSSLNGGITWNPAVPMYTIADCGGLHGHIRNAPDGTLYVPNASCGDDDQGVAVSEDNGLHWRISPIANTSGSGSDPYVDVTPDGTVYFGFCDGNGHAYAAVSRDKARTWSTPYDVGAAVGSKNCEFATIVVGDNDRAAMAFLGTQTEGDTQAANFQGDWYMYVAFTYDGGNTWTTYDSTPGDPVQRGCIWNGGGSNPCRNLLDFFGITRDDKGRVLIGYADGCVDDPLDSTNRCVSDPAADVRDNKKVRHAVIARQNGGLPLLAAYDTIFATAPGAPVLSGIAGNQVSHLTWSVPSTNGAAITKYKIYRGTGTATPTLLTSVGGSVTSYDDAAVSNGTTYSYQVSAVNSAGEGAQSNVVQLTPQFSAPPSAPQRLKAMGRQAGILLTWSAPKSSGTAPVTAYKVYRGTVSGQLTLLTTPGNETRYVDTATTAGNRYYYQVTAVNAAGESARSNEDSAEPK